MTERIDLDPFEAPPIGAPVYIDADEDGPGGATIVVAREWSVSAGKPTWFVGVMSRPGVSFNWPLLAAEQVELRARFGEPE